MFTVLATLLVSLTFESTATDSFRLVDGRIIAGEVIRHGTTIEVATFDGPMTFDTDDVLSEKSHKELMADYRDSLDAAKAAGAYALFTLAQWCERHGLEEPMLDCLDGVLEATPDHAPTHQMLFKLVNRRVLTETDVSFNEKKLDSYLRKFKHRGFARRRLVAMRLAPSYRERTETVTRIARKGGRATARLLCTEILGILRPRDVLKTMVHLSVKDTSEPVRARAADIIASFENPRLLRAFIPTLTHSVPRNRERTIEALGSIGGRGAVSLLISHLAALQAPPPAAASGGNPGSTRSHIFTGNITSYVADYDVEIATNAVIADPVIRPLITGSVLDVTVHGISGGRPRYLSEQKRVAGWLNRLTGQDFGLDAKAWKKWKAATRPHTPESQAPPSDPVDIR